MTDLPLQTSELGGRNHALEETEITEKKIEMAVYAVESASLLWDDLSAKHLDQFKYTRPFFANNSCLSDSKAQSPTNPVSSSIYTMIYANCRWSVGGAEGARGVRKQLSR